MKRFLWIVIVMAAAAGIAYLATLGCCRLMAKGSDKPIAMAEGLSLSAEQKSQVAALEQEFLARKEQTCGALCAKRAQLIALLKQPEPDRATLYTLTEEIGQEQTALEKATLEHLLAVSKALEPEQRRQLVQRVSGQLRSACEMTACGSTAGCHLEKKEKP